MPVASIISLITAAMPVLLELLKMIEESKKPGALTASATSSLQGLFDAHLAALAEQLRTDVPTLMPIITQLGKIAGIK